MPRLARLCRRFLLEESGAVIILAVILLPLLLLVGGIATDVSLFNAQQRYTQSQADLAAQSAARLLPDPAATRAAARQVVAANAKFGTLSLADTDIVLGHHSPETGFRALPDQANPVGATAVRVVVPSPFRPLLLAPLVSPDQITIQRTAVGRKSGRPMAQFVLRNRLLGVNSRRGILDSVLGPLGLGLTTNVLSYEGLANTRLQGSDILNLFTLGLGVEAVSFDDVLNLPVAVPTLLQGMQAMGYLPPSAIAAMPALPGSITFADVLGMDPALMVHAGDVLPDVDISALDLLSTFAALASRPDQRIGLSTGVDLAPLAALDLDLGLIRPPVRVIASPQDDPPVVAELRQIELGLAADVAPLAGLAPLLRLEADLEVAGASAVVTAIECSLSEPQVTFSVTTWPAALGVKLGLLDVLAFNSPRALDPIHIAGTVQTVTVSASALPMVVPVNNRINLSGVTGGLNNVLQQLRSDAEQAKSQKEQERLARIQEREAKEQERQQRIADACRRNPLSCLGGVLGGVLGGLVDGLTATIDGLTSVIDGLTSVILDITSVIDGLTQVLGNVLVQSTLLDTILDRLLALLGIEEAQAEIVLEAVNCAAGGGAALVE